MEAVCVSRPEAARRTDSFVSGQAYVFRTGPSPPPPSSLPPRPPYKFRAGQPKGTCRKCETLPICPISQLLVEIPGSLLCLKGNWTSVLVIALRPQPTGEGRGRRRGRAGKHGERREGERGIIKGKGERLRIECGHESDHKQTATRVDQGCCGCRLDVNRTNRSCPIALQT